MNHICVLTVNGGGEVLYKLPDGVAKPTLSMEFRGVDLGAIADAAMLALGSIRITPVTAKKKGMVVVAQEMFNQTVAALQERAYQNFDITGQINSNWRVYNVPEFNLYDKTYQV